MKASCGSFLSDDGWAKFNTWEHSDHLRKLYARRCSLEAEEMTCHAQAVELLQPMLASGDTLLDVGCGSGYLFHSFRTRGIQINYFGIDSSPVMIEIGKKILPKFGLPAENLQAIRIEDLNASVDHVACINVLSNIDNYHRPLERLLKSARKSLVIRESCADLASCQYVSDDFLDDVKLKLYVNTYQTEEFMGFIRSYGFEVRYVVDRYTQGKVQDVIGYPHHWKFFICNRVNQES